MPPLIPAAKLRPVGPSTTTRPPVMYSQPWSPTPSTTALGAGVAHREALAGEPAEERAARRGAVEHGVADDHVLLGGESRVLRRPHREHAAGEALADVVVRVAVERQLDAGREPRAERLARRAVQLEARRPPSSAARWRRGARAARRPCGSTFRDSSNSPPAAGASISSPVERARRAASSGPRCGAAACRRDVRARAAGSRGRCRARCQCSSASSGSSRSTRPTSSSNRRMPSDAMICRTSSATWKKYSITCSGLPRKRARSSGSCVAIADRARVQVAGAHHHAAGRDQRRGREAHLVGAEQCGDHDVAARLQLTVRLHPHAGAQAVEHERLLRLREPDLPRHPRVQDRRDRRGARAAVVAGDEDVVGVRLDDAGGNGADAHLGDELHRDARRGVRAAEVVDQLLEVLDRVDVVMRRRRDQADARRREADRARCTSRPCGRAAGRPRRAWRPGPS